MSSHLLILALLSDTRQPTAIWRCGGNVRAVWRVAEWHMEITGPRGEKVGHFEEWASIFHTSKKQRHWKQYRSAYSVAKFVTRLNCLDPENNLRPGR